MCYVSKSVVLWVQSLMSMPWYTMKTKIASSTMMAL